LVEAAGVEPPADKAKSTDSMGGLGQGES